MRTLNYPNSYGCLVEDVSYNTICNELFISAESQEVTKRKFNRSEMLFFLFFSLCRLEGTEMSVKQQPEQEAL